METLVSAEAIAFSLAVDHAKAAGGKAVLILVGCRGEVLNSLSIFWGGQVGVAGAQLGIAFAHHIRLQFFLSFDAALKVINGVHVFLPVIVIPGQVVHGSGTALVCGGPEHLQSFCLVPADTRTLVIAVAQSGIHLRIFAGQHLHQQQTDDLVVFYVAVIRFPGHLHQIARVPVFGILLYRTGHSRCDLCLYVVFHMIPPYIESIILVNS